MHGLSSTRTHTQTHKPLSWRLVKPNTSFIRTPDPVKSYPCKGCEVNTAGRLYTYPSSCTAFTASTSAACSDGGAPTMPPPCTEVARTAPIRGGDGRAGDANAKNLQTGLKWPKVKRFKWS
jgi:hypothetical protein